jgi:hypothetical protein
MRPLLAALLALLPLALGAQAERTCTLRFAWWDAPATTPGPTLALGSEKDPRAFNPQVMNLVAEVRHVGGDMANLLVKEVSKDERGREIVRWNPFGTVALPQGEDTFGVLLITDAAGKRGAGRAFPLSNTAFPLGSIRLVNLSNREMLLGISGRGARVPAGGTVTHPRAFAKPEIAEVTVLAAVNGGQQPVFSTKSQFSDLYRLVIFVIEAPGSDPARFEVRTIVDYPQPPSKAPAAPGGRAKPPGGR